jgi:hypothetical protein
MHLQIDRIPSEYNLQRYTYSAIQDVTFSRDDKNLKGKDGETKSYRQKMFLKKAMLQRWGADAGRKTGTDTCFAHRGRSDTDGPKHRQTVRIIPADDPATSRNHDNHAPSNHDDQR